MNTIVETINAAGGTFVDFALPMLVQSSLLIVILLAVDAVLRRRVRAVFRYWIWMLVLVKLVLPPSLWSPASIGGWFGNELEVSTVTLFKAEESQPAESPSALGNILSPPTPELIASPTLVAEETTWQPLRSGAVAPSEADIPSPQVDRAAQSSPSPALTVTWQGLAFLLWASTVAALLLLLVQRAFFVRGLVAQAQDANRAAASALEECRTRIRLRAQVSVKLSPNASSPAVCGLLRPTILVPQDLAPRLHTRDLQAVLLHELAHVKRGDLWINLAQTLLQIAYFYNPLLWLANALIRRIREQAVDETVLVAMGEAAPQYPETLVSIAKLAFRRRPGLSLRLIGVVESRSALSARIRHILSHPLPKTARLGGAGLAVVAIVAAVLLPMAAAQNRSDSRSAGREPSTAGSPGAPQAGLAAQDASIDLDGDGLPDFQETHKYLTDPRKSDSDGDGTPDGDWNERREYTYSVRTVLRYMPPFDEDGLNDDFQDARVLRRTGEYIEVEVTHYPLATAHESVPENRNWRRDYAPMTESLAPGVTTNWNEQMRRDLRAALQADGIDVETLSDKQVVEQVSRWLLKRSRYLDRVFTTYYVHFPQGKPQVYPGLEDAFRREFERDQGNYDWALEQHFDHELLGKGMFYNRTHGSCTSTAIYLTTVLRALGIPTRMVLATPAVDASDRAQILMVKNAITHHRVRLTMLAGLGRSSHGFSNHTFNEVYVGNRWCRLDYSQLGCPTLGLHRFGLQTHLYTLNDLSEVNFAPTWGRRYAKGERNDVFRHDNPYAAVEVSELFGPHGKVPNPPFTAQELDSHPQPDVFLFYPSRANVVSDFLEIVDRAVFNRTSRPHQTEFYENLFEGLWLKRPQDILVLLFSLDSEERIPQGYEDLLPQPWAAIESQLRQGQTVELRGRAREMNVILLAAPTADGLKPLVQSSSLLTALGGPRPASGTGLLASQPASGSAATYAVQLADGVTVELLGVCRHPSEGKQWWRPDGSLRETAPYRTTGGRMQHEEGYQDYEFALRVSGPADMEILWKVPGGNRGNDSGAPLGQGDQRLADLRAYTCNRRTDAGTANVFVGVAGGEWRTVATHEAPHREGSYTLEGERAVAFGGAYEKEGNTCVPVSTNIQRVEMNCRVVAVDEEGGIHTAAGSSGSGGNVLHSSTCRFHLPLARVKALRFQTRPWTWVAYKGVSLQPGHATSVSVELQDTKTMMAASRQVPGEEKIVAIGPAWEALRDEFGQRYHGSIGGFSTDERRCARYFEEMLDKADPGDTFLLMFAFDQTAAVPAQYQDLLPLPWSEIESRVGKGEQVEAQGTARGLTVVCLAAPTLEQLNTLVRWTPLLEAFRARVSAEGKTPADDQGAGGGALVGPGEANSGGKKLFSVYGTVTDPSGRPMAGVEVAAHCGFATLMPTGRAVTDEAGRYTLYFGPGFLSRDVMLQAATIYARKSGFHEVNLCRQGNLAMAGKAPGPEDQARVARFAGVVLPNQPHELNFVMRPAARIEGELVDVNSQRLPGRRMALTGDKLYPSSSVLAAIETDQDGRFIVESVPLESFRFEAGRDTPAKSNSTRFAVPGTWKIRLRYDDSPPGKLAIVALQQPAPPSPEGADRPQPAPDARHCLLQLGLAIAMYANEHDGQLPPTLASLEPYLSDSRVFAWLGSRAVYTAKGNVKDYPAAHSTVTAYEKSPQPTGERYVVFLDGHVELAGSERFQALVVATGQPPGERTETLTRLVAEAQPGATVVVPKGTHRTALEITKPLVLRGESPEECVIEVTANQPAILVDTGGKGQVTVENVTVKWQLATSDRVERAFALMVKDSQALIRNCRFVPLGNYQRSPVAVQIDGFSKATIDRCRFTGFEYTVCYGAGTEGVVQDCILTDSGHQGVTNYDRATMTVQRCLITGSKFHAVRCTGGALHVKDNLLVKNANRAIYLGNKSGRGTITNNLILENGTGISGFAQAEYTIGNNVIVRNGYAGIDMRDSCRLTIRNNVLTNNQRGLMLHKEGTRDTNRVAANTLWKNDRDLENIDKPAEPVATADPQFADPSQGDFTVRGPAQKAGHGLTNPQIIRELWKKYEQLQRERPTEAVSRTNEVPQPSPQAQAPVPPQTSSAQAEAPVQAPGPIQQRIDAATPGATVRLEPGVYRERLVINKPLTLEGAGWDKTVVMIEKENFGSIEDAQRLVLQRVAQAPSDAERERIAAQAKEEFAKKISPLMLSVENAQGVTVRGIKFSSPGGRIKGMSMNLPIVKFDHSRVQMSDCAVLNGPGDGLHVLNGSAVEIDKTLVAAVWGTGIIVGAGPGEAGVRIHDCDIRNCHYAGVGIRKNAPETVIERCRIWGAAWHGIRYDDTSPTILGNLIYGHARFGIYASGQTAATVRNNLFYANEMTGMACWFQSNDLIEGNTFVNNKEAGLAILGASKPRVRRNIVSGNPVAVSLGSIGAGSPFAKSEGTVVLEDNLFWRNDRELQLRHDAATTEVLAVGNGTGTVRADPGFAAPASKDFSLRADSPARTKGLGAGDLLTFDSPWPLQPEELAIIPTGDTRDYSQWREPISSRL